MLNETLMTTERPQILSALEQAAMTDIYKTPLIERVKNDFSWCEVYVADNNEEVVEWGEGPTKVRGNALRVIYWGEHPAQAMWDDEDMYEELKPEGWDDDCDEIPESVWEMGESALQDCVASEVEERLGVTVTQVSDKSELYCSHGGWVVEVRTQDRYSVDLRHHYARIIAA